MIRAQAERVEERTKGYILKSYRQIEGLRASNFPDISRVAAAMFEG